MDHSRIEAYNSFIFGAMSSYLNNCADFITPEMMKEATDDGLLSEKEAYAALLAGALNAYEDREFVGKYISRMVRPLKTEDYTGNPYYKNIVLPDVRDRDWKFEYKTIKPYEAFVFDDPVKYPDGSVIPQIGFFNKSYSYPCVTEGGREWMLITPNEINTMKAPVENACGNVVTYGLGLGYYAYMASRKENVKKITVVEKDENVINLFMKYIYPQIPEGEKIAVINEDAFEYASKLPKDTDCVFADIWHDPSDGIEAYRKFKKLEIPGIRYDYWIEKTLLLYL